MKAVGKFTKVMWENVESIFDQIIQHPFVIGLSDGNLPHKNFAHYLAQDILYLSDDAKALKLLSEKDIHEKEKKFFKKLATDGIEIERILHNEFLPYFNVEETNKKSNVCKEYTEFLLNHSRKSNYPVALAALLPCFWLYYKTGDFIVKNYKQNNPYQKWIETYAGDEYRLFTQQFIEIAEQQGSILNDCEKVEMLEAFTKASEFELAFFESAMSI